MTPAQDRLHFAAFDITTGSRAQLVALLKAWTTAAERMTQGLPAGPIGPTEGAPLAPIQIFASDIDDRALAVARAGVFPEAIAADVSPARLRQFFSREQSQ